MSNTRFFAVTAAALVVACVAGWALSETPARAVPTTVQIDTIAAMTGAKNLPTEHFVDYSFVF